MQVSHSPLHHNTVFKFPFICPFLSRYWSPVWSTLYSTLLNVPTTIEPPNLNELLEKVEKQLLEPSYLGKLCSSLIGLAGTS